MQSHTKYNVIPSSLLIDDIAMNAAHVCLYLSLMELFVFVIVSFKSLMTSTFLLRSKMLMVKRLSPSLRDCFLMETSLQMKGLTTVRMHIVMVTHILNDSRVSLAKLETGMLSVFCTRFDSFFKVGMLICFISLLGRG